MSLLNKSYLEICGESEDRKWVTSCEQSDLRLVCDFPRSRHLGKPRLPEVPILLLSENQCDILSPSQMSSPI